MLLHNFLKLAQCFIVFHGETIQEVSALFCQFHAILIVIQRTPKEQNPFLFHIIISTIHAFILYSVMGPSMEYVSFKNHVHS